jgi:hypothetical protein
MGTFKGDSNSRRIDRALQHVSKPWFPMDPKIVKQIRVGLQDGTYASDVGRLFDDLKVDFALFTFIIKELSQHAAVEGIEASIIANPIELIRRAGCEKILEVLKEQEKLPSVHLLHWSEPFQVQRLRETAIAAGTASALSEQSNLDPDLGFSRGVLRSIGLNLIAWNYPTVYSKALDTLTEDTSLDEILTNELGFSPALLGMRLLRPDTASQSDSEVSEKSWATYDELCEIGELLARAENPETYPSAQNDWNSAKKFMAQTFGDETISSIRSKIIESSKYYQENLPEVFGDLESFDPQAKIEKHAIHNRTLEDSLLNSCPEEIKTALRSLYADMGSENVNKALVGRLLKQIVPNAGFTGGCVFVVDPSSLSLKPRTLIGNVQLREITNVALEPGDAAVSALSSTETIVQSAEETSEQKLTGLYSALGIRRKIGVLYLETPHTTQDDNKNQQLAVFQALKQALCDTLLLE